MISGKESACNAGDMDLIPRLGRSRGGGNGDLSNILAWEILWTEEFCGLLSMGLLRVGHKWATKQEYLFFLRSFFFFLKWTVFLKVFTEFVTVLFYVLVFWPGGIWGLSSQTRRPTHTPGQSLYLLFVFSLASHSATRPREQKEKTIMVTAVHMIV